MQGTPFKLVTVTTVHVITIFIDLLKFFQSFRITRAQRCRYRVPLRLRLRIHLVIVVVVIAVIIIIIIFIYFTQE